MEQPILDLGCGEGLFAHVLFDQKIETGIDPNARELERAKELNAYEELFQCSGNKIPKPDGFYRTVFSNSVLEHIPDLDPVLCEVNRILVIDGVFYLTVPSDNFDQFSVMNQLFIKLGFHSLAQKFRTTYNHFWKHYHFYSRSKWEERIKNFGFEILESREYDPLKICKLNDFLAPFGVFSFFIKRFTNRWVICPTLRHCFFSIFIKRFDHFLDNGEKTEKGGLIFVAARKVKTC